MDAYYGEIRIFAGTYAPVNWAFCDGQLQLIRQNTALFGILGTIYGGDGKVTFGLPNLQGIIPIGVGTGQALTPRELGETVGNATYTVDSASLPIHNHFLNGVDEAPLTNSPTNGFLASGIGSGRTVASQYSDNTNIINQVDLDLSSIGITGNVAGPTPVSDMQPFLPLNFIICCYGVFPPRP